jgi:hypothetical protein
MPLPGQLQVQPSIAASSLSQSSATLLTDLQLKRGMCSGSLYISAASAKDIDNPGGRNILLETAEVQARSRVAM